jgi:hypothetical protein
MSLLNFEPSAPLRKGSKKPFKLILGIGALVGTIALGSTLAASINLNGGGPVEFGQGVTQTTACDDEITLTPYSSFVNADGGGSFMGTRIVISGVDSSAEGCSGKNLTITGFTSSEPIAQIIVEVASESPWFTIGDAYGATLEVESSSSFAITIDPDILPIEASEVTRFTIESSNGSGEESIATLLAGFDAAGPNSSAISTSILIEDGVPTTWQNSVVGGSDIALSGHTIVGGDNGHILIGYYESSESNLTLGGSVGSGLNGLTRATVEMWIYFDPTDRGQDEFTGRQNSSLFSFNTTDDRGSTPECGYTLALRDGYLGINTCNSDTYGFDKSNISIGWHHLVWIASTGEQETQKIYLDGTLRSLDFSILGGGSGNPRPNIGNGPFLLPGWIYGGDSFKIGALNIYSGELGPSTITSNLNAFQARLP